MTSSYYNPVTELTYEQGADGIWRVEIGSGGAQSLHYLGTITPPADPATKIADPNDGDFYVYDSNGTAWNGDTVEAGYWVLFNPINGWQNISVSLTPGVKSVNVSGGLLSLNGTAEDPVINLDATDFEAALDDRYLQLDGTNNYEAPKLTLSNSGGASIDNDTLINLETNSIARLQVASNAITASTDVHINDSNKIEFKGSSGNRLDMEASTWGALSSDGTPQLQWGYLGLKLREELNANSKKITNVPTPIDGGDAANMAYVDSKEYTLPAATTSNLGGIKVGDGLAITVDGTLSLSGSGDFVKKSGDIMTGKLELRNAYPLQLQTSSGGVLTEFYRHTDTELRQNVKAGKTFKLIGYDNGSTKMCMQVRSRGSGNGNLSFVIRNLDRPTDQTDAVTLGYLEEELAKIGGADLATQTVAGTVKVNVTTSETAGIDAVYRQSDGQLFVRKAATGTNNNSSTGTQRGVAAFHSDSFAASNGFITLKAATSAKLGGVKASSTSSDTSSAFVIESDGTGKIRNSSSSTVGVSKRGQICTKNGAPTASDYGQGQMVLRTDSFAVYIKV